MRGFLGRPLPPGFALLVVVLPAGGERAYDEAEWRDAIVRVERGQLELECASGARQGFDRGAVLALTGPHYRALRNPGRGPAVLVAVSRRA